MGFIVGGIVLVVMGFGFIATGISKLSGHDDDED